MNKKLKSLKLQNRKKLNILLLKLFTMMTKIIASGWNQVKQIQKNFLKLEQRIKINGINQNF